MADTSDRAETVAQKRWVVENLLSYWTAMPNLRLCQLIVNACGRDPYYVEDFELLRKLEQMIKDTSQGQAGDL